jgi:error-prone DNA polymerase
LCHSKASGFSRSDVLNADAPRRWPAACMATECLNEHTENPPMNQKKFPKQTYAELHCTSNFSFLQGGSHPDELVLRAAELGYAALAITDRMSLAGIVRAHGAAKTAGIPLVVGAVLEVQPVAAGARRIPFLQMPSMPHARRVPRGRSGEAIVHQDERLKRAAPDELVVWVQNRAGYANLCRLLTAGHASAGMLQLDDVAAHAEGLLAGVSLRALASTLSHGSGQVAAGAAFEAEEGRQPQATLGCWKDIFGDRFYALAEVAREGCDEALLMWYREVARAAGVPLVAAGDVRYHVRSRMPLFDALCAVRHGGTIEEVRGQLLSNAERHLHPLEAIRERFAMLPGVVERTGELAARCTFSLDELRYEYPDATVPPGQTPSGHLAHLAWKGARKRYPRGIPEKVHALIEHELALIAELGYEAYFLTVFDIVRFARRRGILCQGRGSAANSAICYCLGITSVDPARANLLFERFVSRERREAPDIDVDFEHQRREEVLQYIYETYGRERAGMTAEVIRYRLRSAVRDMGKAIGLSLDRLAAIADCLDVADRREALPGRLREAGLDPESETGQRLVWLINELIGFPRHLGQHVGGMVITRGDLRDLVPIQPATMPGRTIVQWDKDDLDELGILKVDCLALGMLTAIRRAFELIENAGGPKLTLASVPAEDPAVYEMISQADTVGVFQIESRAQMSMLPRLKPACFYDLVIEVAIVRPGPIQGDMVHPYLRRRNGEEQVEYPSDAIREVLEKTLGVPLFQEQAMRLAVVAAGFTPGEADQLRRAMGAWRRPGLIEEFRQKLIAGMLARGLSQRFAEQVFGQIRGFGEYGFPESHAASFALLVYVSAWLKRHHPAAFTAALLASQPMGFYAPAQLVRDARAHGVKVLPADVQASGWHARLEFGQGETTAGRDRQQRADAAVSGASHPALRLGLEMVHGLGEAAGRRIEEACRKSGGFASLEDLARQATLDRGSLLHLARAGAVGSLEANRRLAVWEAMDGLDRPGSLPLFERPEPQSVAVDDDGSSLVPMTRCEQVLADYRSSGLSLEAHPVHFMRGSLAESGVVTAAAAARLPEGRRVRVAGIVLSRQRPATAKGIVFLTIEDETGSANVVVRPPVWQAADVQARRAALIVVEGRIQRRGSIVHVLATHLDGNVAGASALPRQSRDFC